MAPFRMKMRHQTAERYVQNLVMATAISPNVLVSGGPPRTAIEARRFRPIRSTRSYASTFSFLPWHWPLALPFPTERTHDFFARQDGAGNLGGAKREPIPVDFEKSGLILV